MASNILGQRVPCGDAPTAFELCGQSAGSCRFAAARIVGRDPVRIEGSTIRPARLRYCCDSSPVCTLSGPSRLPAGPFEVAAR
jgi:sialate O-acetylesterase